MNPSNLPLDGIVLGVGARRPFMTRHVHTHDVQMLWEVLGQIMERKKSQDIYTRNPILRGRFRAHNQTGQVPSGDPAGNLTLTTVSHVSL